MGVNECHLMFDGRELDVASMCGIVVGVRMKKKCRMRYKV